MLKLLACHNTHAVVVEEWASAVKINHTHTSEEYSFWFSKFNGGILISSQNSCSSILHPVAKLAMHSAWVEGWVKLLPDTSCMHWFQLYYQILRSVPVHAHGFRQPPTLKLICMWPWPLWTPGQTPNLVRELSSNPFQSTDRLPMNVPGFHMQPDMQWWSYDLTPLRSLFQ